MSVAAIALGSNLSSPFGDPEANLREAVRRLADMGYVTAVSSFRATEPVGYLDQPRFINAAALLETRLAPVDLLRGLLSIEHAMGRDRANGPPKGPRILDLDLLLYRDDAGRDVMMSSPDLMLPHPAMHERRFVLEPLGEIAPAWTHPVSNLTVEALLRGLGA
jgi:2-amino-4-hydroxy-6-hydroxymethyldihydropteridine diphosphokinase